MEQYLQLHELDRRSLIVSASYVQLQIPFPPLPFSITTLDTSPLFFDIRRGSSGVLYILDPSQSLADLQYRESK